jgi:hypothetical protein
VTTNSQLQRELKHARRHLNNVHVKFRAAKRKKSNPSYLPVLRARRALHQARRVLATSQQGPT